MNRRARAIICSVVLLAHTLVSVTNVLGAVVCRESNGTTHLDTFVMGAECHQPSARADYALGSDAEAMEKADCEDSPLSTSEATSQNRKAQQVEPPVVLTFFAFTQQSYADLTSTSLLAYSAEAPPLTSGSVAVTSTVVLVI